MTEKNNNMEDVIPASAAALAESEDIVESKSEATKTLSQWQLIRRRFVKHKLAVGGLLILITLYSMAMFSEFFATYHREWKDLGHGFCPPQRIRFSLRGPYVHPMKRGTDPVTFQQVYTERKDIRVPLSFCVPGTEYRVWGLLAGNRHFLGVDHKQLKKWHPEYDEAELGIPTFYFLGADKYGQDIFTRIVIGARISLSVGLIGIAIGFVLGLTIGGISGYLGGMVDNIIQRSIEILNSFPKMPLWLALGAIMPADWPPLKVYFGITVVLSMLGWTGLARVVRGKILSLREEDYAMAARLLGANHARIIFRHLLPGFTSHIIVAITMSIPGMILGETSLSFLGLGLRPPVVSWGVMLQDCMDMNIVQNYPWLLLPVVFIIVTVLCFNFLGDGLRDAADPYSSR